MTRKLVIIALTLIILAAAGCIGWFYYYPSNNSSNHTNTATNIAANTNLATTINADIFLVAIDDNGVSGTNVGCGDSLVPVEDVVQLDASTTTAERITAALNQLFSIKTQVYGESGLYNSLYQSSLTVGTITQTGTTYEVPLTGTISLGGECDTPRAEQQIIQTVRQFSGTDDVLVTLNGQALQIALSAK